MTQTIPQTQKQWLVDGRDGFDSLKFQESAPVPKPSAHQVLVKSTKSEAGDLC